MTSKICPSFGDLMVPYPIFKNYYQIIIDPKAGAGSTVVRLSLKKNDKMIIGVGEV